jgi:hypothetical protein
MRSFIDKLDAIENFSTRKSIFESIGAGDPYFRTWEKEIHPLLCEVALQPDQIQQLFKSIETGAGRSTLGKAGDALGAAKDKISDVWFNKFGGMLQSSGPVQAFDQKFESIKASIASKNPQLAAKLAKYGEFAKNNPRLHKFLLAIAGSAAAALGVAVAGGIGAGALAVGTGTGIAVGIVNIADRLLQGQKASTAIGRGATAGAVAGITAAGLSSLGSWLGSLREKSIPFGPKDAGLEQVGWGASRTLSAPGFSSSETLRGFNVLVTGVESEKIRAAMDMIKGGGEGAAQGFRQLKDLAELVRSPEYRETMGSLMQGAWEFTKSNDSMLHWINGVTQAATTAGGAVAGQTAGGAKENPSAMSESLNNHQLNELFGITGNKVDASALQKAWQKAGSPTDSDAVAKILQDAGVDTAVISKAYADMNITAPTAASTDTTQPSSDKTTGSVNIQDLVAQIMKLSAAEQKQVLAHLKK